MRIFTRLLAVAGLACATLGASAADVTIKFLRPSFWTATPHVHVYCATGDLANNQEMTAIPDLTDWFQYELKNTPETGGYNVMFNNGGWEGGQSGDFYVASPGNYSYTLDNATDLKVIEVPDPTAPFVTIRFIRPADWSAVPHIHIYYAVEGGSDVTVVNDKAMTATATAGVYEYIYSNPNETGYNVMFNNGGWSGGQCGPVYEEKPANTTFKVENGALVVESTTGIEAISAAEAEAPAVFYNLQGARVLNPERGIYIRVQAGKASKVIL